jgi:hypothetical protein
MYAFDLIQPLDVATSPIDPDVILYARAAFIKKHTILYETRITKLSADIRLHATDINKKQEYAEQPSVT